MDASGSEHRLLRLGRFNPHLRRWGARRSMIKIPSSFAPIMDCIQPATHAQASQPDSDSSSATLAAVIDEHETEKQPFSDLFITSTPDESAQEGSMLDVGSLAASFRAVAAHELRARSGLTHGAGRRDRMFRHLMG